MASLKVRVEKRLKTGVIVARLLDNRVPRIGSKFVYKGNRVRVLDVIGPVGSPYVVLYPEKGSIEGEVNLVPLKRRGGRR